MASVAAEEGLIEHVTLTAEPGVIGGQPASGLDFGFVPRPDDILADIESGELEVNGRDVAGKNERAETQFQVEKVPTRSYQRESAFMS
mgnify:CR=1 FL=1